jgi:hypothetical protein
MKYEESVFWLGTKLHNVRACTPRLSTSATSYASLHDDHICFCKVCIPPVPNFLVLSLSRPPSCPGAVSPDRALCLPTFSHFVIVNKTSLARYLPPSLCLVILETVLGPLSCRQHPFVFTHCICQRHHYCYCYRTLSHTQSPTPHTRILSALDPPGHTLFSTPPVLSASHSCMFNISSWCVHALLVLHLFHHRYARCTIAVVHSQAFSALSSPHQR